MIQQSDIHKYKTKSIYKIIVITYIYDTIRV